MLTKKTTIKETRNSEIVNTHLSKDNISKDKLQNNILDKEHSKELGGRKGPEPTRFGDWEKNGRCIDF